MALKKSRPDTSAWRWETLGQELQQDLAEDTWKQVDWSVESQRYYDHLLSQHERIDLPGISTPQELVSFITAFKIIDTPISRLGRAQVTDLEQKVERTPGDFQRIYQEQINLEQHIDSERLLDERGKLILLGKPGVGKTTYVKYLTLLATQGDVNRIPIFVRLSEYKADKGLLKLLSRAFEYEKCAIPDKEPFLEKLLEKQPVILLLDGLNEIPPEDLQKSKQAINEFSDRFSEAKIFVTCRSTGIDLRDWLKGFETVEIANFDITKNSNNSSIFKFARKWFTVAGIRKLDGPFWRKLMSEDKNRAMRDISGNPRLLAQLCQTFKETNSFPVPHRMRICDNALNPFQETQAFPEDTSYHHLTPRRKRQMLASIAHELFESSQYIFNEEELSSKIESYINGLPSEDRTAWIQNSKLEVDGTAILQAIEADSGILTKIGRQGYVFSYLPLYEYLTACDIVDNAAAGQRRSIPKLLKNAGDVRWHEVILITASLLKSTNAFFETFLNSLDQITRDNEKLSEILMWVKKKTNDVKNNVSYPDVAVRAFYLREAIGISPIPDPVYQAACRLTRTLDAGLARGQTIDRDLDLDSTLCKALNQISALYYDYMNNSFRGRTGQTQSSSNPLNSSSTRRQLAQTLDKAQCLAQDLKPHELSRDLSNISISSYQIDLQILQGYRSQLRDIMEEHRNISDSWSLSSSEIKSLYAFITATNLLVRCLDVGYVDQAKRKSIKEKLLIKPPKTNSSESTLKTKTLGQT